MELHSTIEIIEAPTILFRGRWTEIKKTVFQKQGSSHETVWESCHRPYKSKSSEVQGVNVVPILHKNDKKYFVLIKQFRVPVNGYCIEFPAGNLDNNETLDEAAFRELREETGYTGKNVLSNSNKMILLDPGMSDNSMGLYVVEIDGHAEENKNPSQKLDEAESIDVIMVECDQLLAYIHSQPNDVSISNVVYAFALGYSMQKAISKCC